MSKQLRFFNMYLTTTISVSMVLFLIGLLCTLLLTSQNVINRIKENVNLTLVLTEDVDSAQVARCKQMLTYAPYCKSFRYVSQQDALQEHIEQLGEDPTKFLGYNPLHSSFEVHPTATYAQPDSMRVIDAQLSALPYVERVVYQQTVIDLLNSNFSKAAWGLLIIAAILLLVALTLIINTIRLQIYSQRFIIRTMSLVGATSWIIRAPFVRKNMGIGLAASALAILAGAIYYVQFKLAITLFALTWQNICFVVATITVCGILITTLAALFSTGRYLRMKTDTLYQI